MHSRKTSSEDTVLPSMPFVAHRPARVLNSVLHLDLSDDNHSLESSLASSAFSTLMQPHHEDAEPSSMLDFEAELDDLFADYEQVDNTANGGIDLREFLNFDFGPTMDLLGTEMQLMDETVIEPRDM